MSEVRSRPRISRVSLKLAEASISSACLLGKLLNTTGSLTQVKATDMAIPVFSEIRNRLSSRMETSLQSLLVDDSLETRQVFKASMLDSLKAAPYMICDKAEIRRAIEKLNGAHDLASTHSASKHLLATIETQHLRVVRESLATACSRASAQIGFLDVETSVGPTGILRVVASQPSGHALVSEITLADDGEPIVEMEVVGSRGKACGEILDRYDKALESEGVSLLTPPRRRFTCGVAQLETSMEFARRRLSPEQSGPQTTNCPIAAKAHPPCPSKKVQIVIGPAKR